MFNKGKNKPIRAIKIIYLIYSQFQSIFVGEILSLRYFDDKKRQKTIIVL